MKTGIKGIHGTNRRASSERVGKTHQIRRSNMGSRHAATRSTNRVVLTTKHPEMLAKGRNGKREGTRESVGGLNTEGGRDTTMRKQQPGRR